MRKSIQSFLKYVLSLSVAGFLFWYLYKDHDFGEMLARFKSVNLYWIYASVLLAFTSHYIRGYRWNMLLEPLGYKLKAPRTFLAVMVGYLANFVVPRLGEVSRCGILKKTDNVAISQGFGSVVTERVIDMLCLIAAVLITLLLEFDRLGDFFLTLFMNKTASIENNLMTLIAAGLLFIMISAVSFILIKRNHHKLNQNKYYNKLVNFLRQLVEGLTSVRKLKSQRKFWLSTLGIWVCYFLMTYVVFFSIEETAELGISAGFVLLVLGGIGMATPVQGGIGAFHYLVSGGLLLFGIAETDGIFFAFLLHTTNAIAIIIFGLIAFFISMVIPKRDSKESYVNSK